MLTRQVLDSGAYLEHFECSPNLWTRERIEQSLAQTLDARPPGNETGVWVFAYGSLMWNPMMEIETCQIATLHEWHRSFCLRMIVGRGSAERPGRMLALEPGGHTSGIALKLSPASMDEDLRSMWIREMVLGSYTPTWAPVTLLDGTETHAIAFVADMSRDQFQPDSSVATAAPLMATAEGKFGSNADYLFRLHAALGERALQDPYIDELSEAVARILHGADLKPA